VTIGSCFFFGSTVFINSRTIFIYSLVLGVSMQRHTRYVVSIIPLEENTELCVNRDFQLESESDKCTGFRYLK